MSSSLLRAILSANVAKNYEKNFRANDEESNFFLVVMRIAQEAFLLSDLKKSNQSRS